MKYRSVNKCEALKIHRNDSIKANYIDETLLPDWYLDADINGSLIFNYFTEEDEYVVEINYGTKDFPEWVFGYVGDYIVYRPGTFGGDISVMPPYAFERYWEKEII
jgi:hypothetical protein